MPAKQQPQFNPTSPCFSCAFTQDFHDKVISTLASLEAGQNAIIDRLDHVNGSVAELFKRSNEAAKDIAVLNSTGGPSVVGLREDVSAIDNSLKAGTHPGSAEMSKRVGALEMVVANRAATDKGARGIIKTLAPLAWMAVMGVILLLFQHADTMLSAMSAKGH